MVIALVVIFFLAIIYSIVRRIMQLERLVAAMQQRFFEGGIEIETQLKTDARVPEQWVETDNMNDDEVEAVLPQTGVIRGRRDEWVDVA
jgi:hypothetical protein